MKSPLALAMLSCCLPVAAAVPTFQLGLLPYPALPRSDGEHAKQEAEWQKQLYQQRRSKPWLLVVNGLKNSKENCSDELYQQRKRILEESPNPLLLSLAAQDWSECIKADGESNALERQSFLRDQLYNADPVFGKANLPLASLRQSVNPKFRNFPENVRWEKGNILFATLDLPANNNRYRVEAGRNSEFEDRQVANRDWLNKLFAHARLHKRQAIVLFSDGNLIGSYLKNGKLRAASAGGLQDGFADLQQKLIKLSERYPGRVLLIDHAAQEKNKPVLQWRGKLGSISLPLSDKAHTYLLNINSNQNNPFSLN